MFKNIKKKLILPIVILNLSSSILCFANQESKNNTIENDEKTIITTNNGEKIYDLTTKQYKKIKWEKPFITIKQIDEIKLNEYKKNNPNKSIKEIESIYNNGISGDFLSINQIEKGRIKTDYGEFDILWITNEKSETRNSICNNEICANDLYLKVIDKTSGILYGKFNKLLTSEKKVLNLKDEDFIGLAKIKISDFFKSKPTFSILINDNNYNNYYDLKFIKDSNINNITNNDIVIYTSKLNNNNTIKLLTSKDNKHKALTLEDGTIVYTKEINENKIVELFYLDFDEKNPYNLSINYLGKINKNVLLVN